MKRGLIIDKKNRDHTLSDFGKSHNSITMAFQNKLLDLVQIKTVNPGSVADSCGVRTHL